MDNSLSRRSFLGVTAGAGIVGATGLLTAGCSDAGGGGGNSVRIVNTAATASLTINHLMDELGYFKSFGVNPSIKNVSSGNQVVAALGSGSGDITVLSGFIGVFPAIEKGMNLKALAGTQVIATEAFFTGNPQMKSFHDLAGKTLGVGAVGSQLYDGFMALLKKYDIPQKSVTFRNVGSSADSFKAVMAKQIDCGYGQVGDQALAQKKGVRMLNTVNGELPLYINQGAVASAKAVKSKRKALVKVLASYAKLFEYLTTPGSKSKYVAAYVAAGGSQDEGEIEWQFINQNKAYSPTLDLPVAKANYVQQLNVEAGSQKKVIPYEKYTDLSLRKEALALL
ncbi:ABC transporter substrate-binding protein [Actinomadura sp. DC4]|uniref:ABC transporter substrate-binding protein n=1 Tax=Actinomadura sp. DC4 TaxID=3055069 RepID=UPI0025B1D2BB|nr:ABC transporter substrate-binding protein [Actinomadura sp. DC4]MDN3354108.1 ABC transporter substrate-binding protein [Actinomadura sp. DC4]